MRDTVALVILLMLPCAAHAQNRLYVGAGYGAFTSKPYRDLWSGGPTFGLSVASGIGTYASVEAGASYARHSPSSGNPLGGIGLITGMFSIRLYPVPGPSINPYLKTTYGIQLLRSDGGEVAAGIGGGNHSLAFGAGVQAHIFPAGGLFAEVQYMVAYTGKPNMKRVPGRVGFFLDIP